VVDRPTSGFDEADYASIFGRAAPVASSAV